jgi:putative endonuclease
MTYRQKLGSWGEMLAETYLKDKGLILVGRNIHTHYGEIDLVMQEGETIVFIEVKTRTSFDFGTPEESITKRKKERMLKSALETMQGHAEWSGDYRIDVVAIFGQKGDPDPEILWFENAVG